jgi:hypothetical protein
MRLGDMQRKRFGDVTHHIGAVIVLVGVVLRVRQFAANRPLWVDEAMISLNIINRSFVDLLGQLDDQQRAPAGFLWIVKVFVTWFGNTEFALRLFPLTASICALLLMYRLTRPMVRMPDSVISIVALLMFALSERLVYYASEVKQYSSDVLVTVGLLLLCQRCLYAAHAARFYAYLAGAGTLAVWISHPAVFVLAGITASLFVEHCARKDWRKLLWVSGVMIAHGVSFAVFYAISLRLQPADVELASFWQAGFMPVPPWRSLWWFRATFEGLVTNPLGLQPLPLATALLVIGFGRLMLRKWQLAVGLMVSVAASLVASGLHKYPIGDRLFLFGVPVGFLLLTEGMSGVFWALSGVRRWAAFGVVALMVGAILYPMAVLSLTTFRDPPRREDIRPVMAYVQQRASYNDLIYVYYGAWPAFRFYSPAYGFTKRTVVSGIMSREEPEQYLRDIDRYKNRDRVWFVFSHNCNWCPVNEEEYFVKYLNQVGSRLEDVYAEGASAYLYKLTVNVTGTANGSASFAESGVSAAVEARR